MKSTSDIAEQLEMFERESAWQWCQAQRLMGELERAPVRRRRRVRQSLCEIQTRSAQMLREYSRYLHQEGVETAVRDILAARRNQPR